MGQRDQTDNEMKKKQQRGHGTAKYAEGNGAGAKSADREFFSQKATKLTKQKKAEMHWRAASAFGILEGFGGGLSAMQGPIATFNPNGIASQSPDM